MWVTNRFGWNASSSPEEFQICEKSVTIFDKKKKNLGTKKKQISTIYIYRNAEMMDMTNFECIPNLRIFDDIRYEISFFLTRYAIHNAGAIVPTQQ